MLLDTILPNSSIAGIYLAVVFIILLSLLVFRQKKQTLLVKILSVGFAVLLFYSKSRAGWVACSTSVLYLSLQQRTGNQLKNIIVAFLLLILFIFSVSVFYKPGSSIGRLHVYSVSANILKSNWVNGVGVGKFKAVFNEHQANYFSTGNIDGGRALLADNTFYAFNEYLQWIIETGVTGFLILTIAIGFLWRRSILLQREKGNMPLLMAAKSSFICIMVASLFSYPLHTIPFQFVTLGCVGVLLFYPLEKHDQSSFFNLLTGTIRTLFLLLCIYFFVNTYFHIKGKIAEKEAFELQKIGYKTEALEKYKQLTQSFHRHGYNYYSYAERLYFANRLEEAELAIEKCQRHYVDNNVYKLKAQIETELGKYMDAEQSYLRAVYMVPNRMGSRYDLMNFYISRGDTNNAKHWANSVLHMPVKVPSERTAIMLKATEDSLLKW